MENEMERGDERNRTGSGKIVTGFQVMEKMEGIGQGTSKMNKKMNGAKERSRRSQTRSGEGVEMPKMRKAINAIKMGSNI